MCRLCFLNWRWHTKRLSIDFITTPARPKITRPVSSPPPFSCVLPFHPLHILPSPVAVISFALCVRIRTCTSSSQLTEIDDAYVTYCKDWWCLLWLQVARCLPPRTSSDMPSALNPHHEPPRSIGNKFCWGRRHHGVLGRLLGSELRERLGMFLSDLSIPSLVNLMNDFYPLSKDFDDYGMIFSI